MIETLFTWLGYSLTVVWLGVILAMIFLKKNSVRMFQFTIMRNTELTRLYDEIIRLREENEALNDSKGSMFAAIVVMALVIVATLFMQVRKMFGK